MFLSLIYLFLFFLQIFVISEQKEGLHFPEKSFPHDLNEYDYPSRENSNQKERFFSKRDTFDDPPLLAAVSSANLNQISQLISKGANVNILGSGSKTVLHIAAEKGYCNIIKYLISKKANIEKRDLYNEAPIHYAANSGQLNVVKILLDLGASIDSKGKYGDTALHIAARKGFINITNLLLSRNASADVKNQFRMTPLHVAVIQKELDITETLIAHGANLNARGKNGMTPLMISAWNGDEAIVNLLISKKATIETKDGIDNTATHYAVLRGNIKALNILLDQKADVNSKGLNGKTSLSFAIWRNNEYLMKSLNKHVTGQDLNSVKPYLENETVGLIKLLVEHGAEVNSPNSLHQTVLHEAAAMGYSGIVAYLVSQNASFSIEDYICFTPLQWAANNGHIHVIKTLLDHGDDINRKGCNNVTALHLAIRRNDTDLIKFLLSKNADPNVMSEDGRTPLDIAFQSLSDEILTLLLKHGAKLENNDFLGSKVLFDAVAKKSLDILYLLMESVRNIDRYPTVILNYALRHHFYDGVHLFISSGANIEQKDVHGNLPLSSAVISRNLEMVKLILKTGAYSMDKSNFQTFMDANSDMKFVFILPEDNKKKIVENREFTVLHIASKLGLKDITKLLISNGASLDVRDELGYTPLHYASKEGHIEVVKLFLDSGANKDSFGYDGTTPFQIACRRSQLAIVKLLLSDPPASVNLADNDGYTPLHFAVMTPTHEIVTYLLDHGANKESRTNDRKTPLHIASLKGQKDAAEILLRKGANENAADIDGMTPLHFAVTEGHPKIVSLMLKSGAYVNSRNINGSTPLHLASGSKIEFNEPLKNVIVSSLIVYGANVDSIDYNHMTPLHFAARYNSSEYFKFLLSYKADISSRDIWLNQPIHYAALNGNYDVLLEILNDHKGVTLSMSVNSNHETPLFLAAREGHAELVALLLRAGVEGLQPDFNGRTALHRSACRGHLEVVKILRQALLNKEKKDKWGFTALNYAASWKGHQEVIGYLSTSQLNITLSYYFNKSDPSQQSLLFPKFRRVPKFTGVKVGIPYSYMAYFDKIYQEDKQREKILNFSLKSIAQDVNSTIVGKIVNNGIQDEWLNLSHPFNVREILQIVHQDQTERKSPVRSKKAGSRVTRDIWRGEDSPLHKAIANHDLKKVNEILEIGYNVNLGGFEGKTPLGLAAEKGYESIVKSLLSKNASLDKKDFFDDAPIHNAAYNGKLEIIKILLDHGASVNIKGKYGETALHIAARKGYEDIVDLLISKNASLNLKNSLDSGIRSDPRYITQSTDYHLIGNGYFGETPLHMASRSGHENIVNSLLKRNASVEIKNQIGMTPLYIAVSEKKLGITKTLIAHGANVNTQGNNGMTPLMIAAMNGDEAIANLLISKNASLKIRDDNENQAIHYAALSGNLNVVNALLDNGADGNSKGMSDKTSLNFAVRTKKKVTKRYFVEEKSIGPKKKYKEMIWVNPNLENEIFTVMKTLVNHGAEVNSKDLLDQTVLHEAAGLGYPGVVGYLASEKAIFSIEDYVCFTPLQWAVYNGNIDVIKTLIKYGDDVNRKGCNNVTALHLAITGNNTELIQFLLSKNANTNVMSEDGRTPLDVAFQSSSAEYLTLLLDHKAKLEDNSFLGSKVLFDAVAKKSLDILRLLLNGVKNIDSYPTVILNYAIRHCFYDGVNLLISSGANIKQKDIHGNLPLSSAVLSKNLDMVELILKTAANKIEETNFQTFLDADCEVKFNFNTSERNYEKTVVYRKLAALHIASKLGFREAAKLLISYGASLDIRDERGYTPLHYACEEGNVEVVRLLLDSSADKDSIGVEGTTSLHIACARSLFEIVEILLSDPPAAINLADNNGYTPLHFAVVSGSLPITKLLLKLGAEVEATTEGLRTPLHFASLHGHKEIVEILLKEGADKEASDIEEMTPLHFAARYRQLALLDLLLKSGALVNIANQNGSTPLHLACEGNIKSTQSEIEVVHSLLLFGAEVDPMDHKQMTPLHVASSDNSTGCVEILLNQGADIYSRDMFLNQPIHFAALNGYYEIVFMLLTRRKGMILGLSVNSNGETPLILASREGHTDIVALLLQAGIESFQPDKLGRTALHRGASRGHLEIVKLLRQGLLNIDKENKWGFTALNYAASWRGHQDVIGYLSTTQQNITLSYYLNKTNPLELDSEDQNVLKHFNLSGVTLGKPYSFIDYSDSDTK